ncbi:MAG: hypothetical protein ACOC2K_03610 [Bacteroidota bacterium]
MINLNGIEIRNENGIRMIYTEDFSPDFKDRKEIKENFEKLKMKAAP